MNILAVVSPDLQSHAQQWSYAIAVVTPLIIAGVKKLVPTVPKVLLPCLAPFVGLAVGFGMNALTQANLGWLDMAQLGALGVFVRELVDQSVKAANKRTSS